RVHLKGKGVLLREPAVIAVVKGTTEVKAVGQEAYRMLGRTPGNITAVRPMADGVIADYTLTEKMLKAFISKVLTGPGRFIRPNIMVCIPSGITDVERRAVVQAVREVGARKCYLIEETVAAAIGAGIAIAEPVGSMIMDVGGGTTDLAIISLGGIVVSESLRIPGNAGDRGSMADGKATHQRRIGDRAAGLIDGMPKRVTVTTEDIVTALAPSLKKIADGMVSVLEQAPPELVSDVIERGIVMTGGGALLRNLDAYLGDVTSIPVGVAAEAADCVVLGTAQAPDMVHVLKVAYFDEVRH